MLTEEMAIIDLKGLIEREGGSRLSYAATTEGGEYCGACPFEGVGNDRFRVWPHHEGKPKYWCRHCGESGDPIDFLRNYCGMTFIEACLELGIEPDNAGNYTGTPTPGALQVAPVKLWCDAMKHIIATSNNTLLHGLNTGEVKQYREYLERRRISLDMVEKYCIGFSPVRPDGKWFSLPFEEVGLTEDMLNPVQWAKGCVRIPDGLLLPVYVQGDIWKVEVKRPFVTDGGMTRGQVLGSKECWLNHDRLIQAGATILLTEAYLDAVTADQVAGDLIVPTSTDGTTKTRSLISQAKLQYADHVLLGQDNDEAGEMSAKWWLNVLPGSSRLRPERAKDINEMSTCLLDVRKWVEGGLSSIGMARDGATVESYLVDSPLAIEPQKELTDDIITCVLCMSEVERFTVAGTPCCAIHYDMQQAIDTAVLQALESGNVEYTKEELIARFTKEFRLLFGKCEVKEYSKEKYTIKQLISLRWKEINEQYKAVEQAKEQAVTNGYKLKCSKLSKYT